MNLGGPSGAETIQPFLFNFFMDPNIIGLPLPLRFLLAKWISWSRSKGAAKTAYEPLGFTSPLLENTKKQAAALEKRLLQKKQDIKVFISMRYWHPLAQDVVKDVQKFNPDQIILLPLYPQFSTTTSFSSFQNWALAAEKYKLNTLTKKICCYPKADGFIRAAADMIRKELVRAPKNTRILLSAHGLPEKTIKAGDPYQFQCEETAKAIIKAIGMENLDWEICYQSRVGPLKWIGPSLIESLHKAAADKVGVIIFPHAFVSEHVETLVEIDIECRHLAKKIGLPYFSKVETVGVHPDFIEALASLVEKEIEGEVKRTPCPDPCIRCAQKE